MSGEYGFKYTNNDLKLFFETSTDPAIDAAVTTEIINAYSGVVITTTTTGNAQTLEDPTVTVSGRKFIVANASDSTDNITVNAVVLTPGTSQMYIWDGSAWSTATGIAASDTDNTPAGDIIATNVQDAINELDTEKLPKAGGTMTGSILGSISLGSTGTRLVKGWFTDLEVTNAIAGSVTGNAGTVSTITGLAPDTATTQATQPNITSLGNLTELSIGGDITTDAILDVKSTTKAFMPPRMTAVQATAITASDGMMVYVTDTDVTFTSIGFWGYEDGAWIKL